MHLVRRQKLTNLLQSSKRRHSCVFMRASGRRVNRAGPSGWGRMTRASEAGQTEWFESKSSQQTCDAMQSVSARPLTLAEDSDDFRHCDSADFVGFCAAQGSGN